MEILRQLRTPRAKGSDAPAGVMLLINDLGPGGAERALVNLVNNVTRFRPVVAVLRPVLDLAADLNPDIEIVCVGPPGYPTLNGTPRMATGSAAEPRGRPRGRMLLELPGLVRTAHRLVSAARATNCPVISTFLNRAHTVALTARMLFDRKLRVVINVHEMLSDHLDLHFAPSERWLMRKFITHGFPRAERIVTVADAVTADLVQKFGLTADMISVAYNPVDMSRIKTAGSLSIDENECGANTIVAVGRLVHLKGFDILIRAFALLPVSLDARLIIVGEGVERNELERLIAELGLRNRVSLIGFRSNPWRYMARAKVLAVPSRTEAFPSVIGEAFVLSLPVVAANCSDGISEYLDQGGCGVMVSPNDPNALAVALERVLVDVELRERLVSAGRLRVQAFDMTSTVARYEEMLAGTAG
ncbi:MAG: glycosyltransferase [Gemmatimonadales bacterium]